MKILTDKNGMTFFHAPNIVFGRWEESNDYPKWKMTDEDGTTMLYILDTNQNAQEESECDLIVVDAELPEGYVDRKYLFTDGILVPNPDWVEPPMTQEQLSEKVVELTAALESMDETFIELYEMVNQL